MIKYVAEVVCCWFSTSSFVLASVFRPNMTALIRSQPCPYPPKASNLLTWKKRVSGQFSSRSNSEKKNLRASTAHGRHNKYSSSLTFRSLCNNQLFIYNFLKVESSNWYFVSQSRTLSDFVTVARREQWKDKIGRSSGACFLTVFEDHV